MNNERFKYVCADNEKVLKKCFCTEDKVITVEDDVTHIGVLAFYKCKAEEIRLSDSVREIGNSAFSRCKNLKRIVFGNGMVSFRPGAFYGCDNLNEVVFPQGSLFEKSMVSGVSDSENEDAKTCCSYLVMKGLVCFFFPHKNEILDMINTFLKTGERQMTFRFVVGDRAILMPRFVRINYSDDLDLFMDAIQEWVAGKERSKKLLELVNDDACKIGVALEMYMSEKDKTAKKYLNDNLISWILDECDSECVMEKLIRLGLVKDKDLEKLLDSTDNMPIAKAAVLERIKNRKINPNSKTFII